MKLLKKIFNFINWVLWPLYKTITYLLNLTIKIIAYWWWRIKMFFFYLKYEFWDIISSFLIGCFVLYFVVSIADWTIMEVTPVVDELIVESARQNRFWERAQIPLFWEYVNFVKHVIVPLLLVLPIFFIIFFFSDIITDIGEDACFYVTVTWFFRWEDYKYFLDLCWVFLFYKSFFLQMLFINLFYWATSVVEWDDTIDEMDEEEEWEDEHEEYRENRFFDWEADQREEEEKEYWEDEETYDFLRYAKFGTKYTVQSFKEYEVDFEDEEIEELALMDYYDEDVYDLADDEPDQLTFDYWAYLRWCEFGNDPSLYKKSYNIIESMSLPDRIVSFWVGFEVLDDAEEDFLIEEHLAFCQKDLGIESFDFDYDNVDLILFRMAGEERAYHFDKALLHEVNKDTLKDDDDSDNNEVNREAIIKQKKIKKKYIKDKINLIKYTTEIKKNSIIELKKEQKLGLHLFSFMRRLAQFVFKYPKLSKIFLCSSILKIYRKYFLTLKNKFSTKTMPLKSKIFKYRINKIKYKITKNRFIFRIWFTLQKLMYNIWYSRMFHWVFRIIRYIPCVLKKRKKKRKSKWLRRISFAKYWLHSYYYSWAGRSLKRIRQEYSSSFSKERIHMDFVILGVQPYLFLFLEYANFFNSFFIIILFLWRCFIFSIKCILQKRIWVMGEYSLYNPYYNFDRLSRKWIFIMNEFFLFRFAFASFRNRDRWYYTKKKLAKQIHTVGNKRRALFLSKLIFK